MDTCENQIQDLIKIKLLRLLFFFVHFWNTSLRIKKNNSKKEIRTHEE